MGRTASKLRGETEGSRAAERDGRDRDASLAGPLIFLVSIAIMDYWRAVGADCSFLFVGHRSCTVCKNNTTNSAQQQSCKNQAVG
ncbi:hypothetical protein, partial [Paenibacillus dendritiformis]|uniref:hypothetical protein n=1 Tax=Paenibacillus dendritiformis TaxID=130049 RepID=UPI001EE68498